MLQPLFGPRRSAADSATTRRGAPAAGFTLLELLVTLAVLGVLMTWVAPGFQAQAARQEVAIEVQRLKTALALARSAAITRRTTVSVCPRPTPDSARCDTADWSHPLVVVEGDTPGGRLANSATLRVLQGSGGPTITFNRGWPVRYRALGRAIGHTGTFHICGRHGHSARVIVSNFGRVRTAREAEC